MPKEVHLFCIVVYKVQGKKCIWGLWKSWFYLSLMHWKLFFNISDFLITLLFKIITTHRLFSWHVISSSPPPSEDLPITLFCCSVCGSGTEPWCFPRRLCPIVRAVVFPSPVPSVGLWFSVVLLRLYNISATPKTHNVALGLYARQCGASTAAAWMWRLVHFPECKFPFSSKVFQTGLKIGTRPEKMGDKVSDGPHSLFGRTWSWKAVPVLPSQMVPVEYQGNCWRGTCSFCQCI